MLVLWLVGTLDRAEELLVGPMDEDVEAESKASGLAREYPGHVETTKF